MTAFRYRSDASGRSFPTIPVGIMFGDRKREVFALIDSGAAISVFQPDVAESLGIEILKGKEIFLSGIGGWIKGYIHKLELEIGGKRFSCPVVFSEEYSVSFNLLGRDAFFEKFRITFDEGKNRVELE